MGNSDKKDNYRAKIPIPDKPYTGPVLYDAKDPESKFPPIKELRPPKGAPNILLILLDDVGFGASSTFSGRDHDPEAGGGARPAALSAQSNPRKT